VEFIEGTPRLEPYYAVVVTVPEDVMGHVMGDLSGRRGLILGMEDTVPGKIIKADVPVIECFGYGAHLRSLTRGRGRYELTFVGYRPYRGRSGPGPDVA
jgi:elongation factor G